MILLTEYPLQQGSEKPYTEYPLFDRWKNVLPEPARLTLRLLVCWPTHKGKCDGPFQEADG
jgi:hypothetical protein